MLQIRNVAPPTDGLRTDRGLPVCQPGLNRELAPHKLATGFELNQEGRAFSGAKLRAKLCLCAKPEIAGYPD